MALIQYSTTPGALLVLALSTLPSLLADNRLSFLQKTEHSKDPLEDLRAILANLPQSGNASQRRDLSPEYCSKDRLRVPIYCQLDRELWTRTDLLEELSTFITLFALRPAKSAELNPNDAFALWYTAMKIQPKFIIESGVGKGLYTWWLRQAVGNQVKIFALDPAEVSTLLVRDTTNTSYFMGPQFRDFRVIGDQIIAPRDRLQTLVVLDDHVSAASRLQELVTLGFTHVWSGANFYAGQKGQDCDTFNNLCSPLADALRSKRHTRLAQWAVPVQMHMEARALLVDNLDEYFEFPPISNGMCTDEHELLPEDLLSVVRLPSPSAMNAFYSTTSPAYLRLRSRFSENATQLSQLRHHQNIAETGWVAEENTLKHDDPKFCPDPQLRAPTKCLQGAFHFGREELKELLPSFAVVLQGRPKNVLIPSYNQAFAIWVLAKKLQPKHILEFGVGDGGILWLLRQAVVNDVHIIAIGKEEQTNLTYRDGGPTEYFIQSKENFSSIDTEWGSLVAKPDRKDTLVLFNDHSSAMRRTVEMHRAGFMHMFYGPNYYYGQHGQDCYSFNMMCTAAYQISGRHNLDPAKYQSQLDQHHGHYAFISNVMEVYFEFPAIWNSNCTDHGELLKQDELVEMGFPDPKEHQANYFTFHSPYVRLRHQS